MDLLTCMRIELRQVSNEKNTSFVEKVCLESASGQLFAITNIPSTSSLTPAQMLPLAFLASYNRFNKCVFVCCAEGIKLGRNHSSQLLLLEHGINSLHGPFEPDFGITMAGVLKKQRKIRRDH